MKKRSNSTDTIQLTAVGDISLGDYPVCFGHGVGSMIEREGIQFLFKHVKSMLVSSDIVFGNLETVLANETKSDDLFDMEMKGIGRYAKDLSEIGFNVMSVANNHAMQHGAIAFQQSIENLRNNGIAPVGLNQHGASNHHVYSNGNFKIAVVAYSLRPEKYSDNTSYYALRNDDKMLQQINDLSKSGHIVIISLHWGEEYLHLPSPEQVHLSRKIIDAGAHLVLGHHPHVLQGIEEYGKGVIVYSLGNFIFDMWQKSTRESMIFKCTIDCNGINSYKMIPILINKRYQPMVLTGIQGEVLLNKIHDYSRRIPKDTQNAHKAPTRSAYIKTANNAYKKHRIESYLYFTRNIYRYKFSVIVSSLKRFIKRRINPNHP